MDIQAILRATFIVPLIEPEWQSGLLTQLAATDLAAKSDQANRGTAELKPVFVDMGQGSREQQYSRQKPVLRLIPRA